VKNIISIDIGGSKLLAGVVDDSGKVLAEKRFPLISPNHNSILEIIFSACDEFSKLYKISAIGASIPGLTDSVNGIWVEAAFSKIRDFPLGNLLFERFRCPVFLENDANNCAIGEKYFGCAKDIDDFIWLTVSNGCGAGVFFNGRLFTGQGGNAGELGHIRVTDENFECPCGNTGCLEAVAAGPAISLRYKILTGKTLSAKEIADNARDGDDTAVSVFIKTGEYLGRAIASAVNVVNVPLVVIGGGLFLSFDLFKDELVKTVQQQVYRTANKDLKVMQTKLGYHASMIGAAANALTHLR